MIYIGKPVGEKEKVITLGFVGFHESFDPTWNHITLALYADLPIAVVNTNEGEVPEYLFFSVFGKCHTDARFDRCVKIFTCEENIRVPWHECDFAMSSDRLLPDLRYLRLPIYARFLRHLNDHTGKTLTKPEHSSHAKDILSTKTKFCNFVYSNESAKERIVFFEMLSKYKKVDSGGAVLNNMGGVRVSDKLAFLQDYKFTIAFENARYPGYVSEKIVEPMSAFSIPIYWGCRSIGEDFNPFSFVCANEPEGSGESEIVLHFEQVIHKIVWLDTHDDDYCLMMSEPWFHGNEPNIYCQSSHIRDFLVQTVFSRTFASLPRRDAAPKPAPSRGWCWAYHVNDPRR